jgi:hypothetical protein
MNSSGGYTSYTNIGVLQFIGSISVLPPSVINNNSIAIPIVGGIRDSLYFVDSVPRLICHTSIEFLPIPSGEHTMGIIVLPSKKIAGTGILNNPQDHWNFLTENIERYLVSNCGSTGVIENKETYEIAYNIFPTLFNETLVIKCIENCCVKFKATLFNSLGQEIVSEIGCGELLLNTNNFRKGMYYLHIADSAKIKVFKVIKID